MRATMRFGLIALVAVMGLGIAASLRPSLFGLGLESAAAPAPRLATELVVDGLDQPVFVTSAPGDPRLFVVEQTGRIRILADGALEPTPFLDITDAVAAGGERGLLGLAFHPDYAENRRFFVDYTDGSGNTTIASYLAPADADRADPASAEILLTIPQPAANHNGGWLGFGPDGLLYIGMGDGGASDDRFGNGQNRQSLLGAILRLDVDAARPYAISPTNPYASGDGAPEIFATGLRNPWRMSFDGDALYIGDVGQNKWEEVDVITTADAGANLGWNTMEGDTCFLAASCEQSGLVAPIHVYNHDEGCSITGGYVYRGSAMPDLVGSYLFGDYCSGNVYALRYADGVVSDLSTPLRDIGNLTSFGTDADGELYLTLQDGRILKLVPAAS